MITRSINEQLINNLKHQSPELTADKWLMHHLIIKIGPMADYRLLALGWPGALPNILFGSSLHKSDKKKKEAKKADIRIHPWWSTKTDS